MAQVDDLEASPCLVWKTELPYSGKPRKSSSFSLMGSEWNLQFSYIRSKHYHVVSLHKEISEEPLETEFKVRTFMQHPTFESEPVKSVFTTVRETTEDIWKIQYSSDTIFRDLYWLHEYNEVKVVCIFYGLPPSMIHIKTETKFLSTLKNVGVPGLPEDHLDLENLSCDFANLLDDKDFPDVKLQCQDRTFSAHRSILSARSEVFAAMFRNKMVESVTGVVEVEDLEVEVLDLLLKYVYSGKFPETSEDTVLSLYAAGDKYAIHSLKSACLNRIVRGLTEDNCFRFLTLADLHSSDDFKNAVIEFIGSHETVLLKEDWLKFSEEHPKLVVEVYNSIYKKKADNIQQKI